MYLFRWTLMIKTVKIMTHKETIIIPYLFLTTLFCQLTACIDTESKKKDNAVAPPSTDTVVVFKLSSKEAVKNISLPAELLPYENAELYAKVQGFVKSMKVDIGDRVKKGQTLALVEAPEVNTKYQEFQFSIQAANAKYATSSDQYQRLYKASQAHTPGIVAPADLTMARNQMMADSASLESSKKLAQSYKELAGYLSIQAPFDGLITSRKADPGDLVGMNTMLVTVQNNRTLRLRVAVPENYVTATLNKQIEFKVDGYPEQTFTAKLTRKAETIDPATRTELWEFDYDNSKQVLKAGSFAYVQLKLERTSLTHVVPFSAVVTNQEKRFVIRVKENKLEWIDIRRGSRWIQEWRYSAD